MKKVFIGILTLLLFCFCENQEAAISEAKLFPTPSMKVSSFNIRFNNPGDGFNSWEYRKEHVVSYINLEAPDIVGMQEVLNDQLLYLERSLKNYSYVGVGREDGETRGEYTPIFYDNERFSLVRTNTFWLSETPGEPSQGWDAVIRRICTIAILQDNLSGLPVHVYNTHFDHIGSVARNQSARLIMDSVNAVSEGVRVIVTGDLNTAPGSSPYQTINDQMEDSFNAEIRFGPTGSYNGFNPNSAPFTRRIDFVFHRGFNSENYVCDDITINGNYISDHFPIISTLEYRPLSQ